jgi:carbonic anhydrase
MPAEGGSTFTMPERLAQTPQQALELLMDGNQRWVNGQPADPSRSVQRRPQLIEGQAPFATVFSCIDSRVAPEIVFDCGLGDLVVVRSGAHALGETAVMGSLQFGVDHLSTPLLLVLGHQTCGAVTTAIDAIERDQDLPVGLNAIVESIRPAYDLAKSSGDSGDIVMRTVQAHTRLTVQAISRAPLIDRLVESGTIRVVGAYYSFDTGAVSVLD